MPAKKQRRPATPPSEASEDEDEGYVIDPEQIFDILPQPFRLIEKTVNRLFDKAWEIIEGIEDNNALRKSKECLPSFDCGKPLHECPQPSCMCGVDGGKYLFVAHSSGLAVVEALIGQTAANYEDTNSGIVVEMSASEMQDGFILISTLDDTGTAKLYCFAGDQVHLSRVFNDEGSKGAIATAVQLSPDSNFIAVGWELPQKESWLEVYRIPKDTWIKELETAMTAPKSRKPTLSDYPEGTGSEVNVAGDLLKPSDEADNASIHSAGSPPGSRPGSGQGAQPAVVSSFTKPSMVLRVRPPAPVGPCTATNYIAALKSIDSDSSVIGTGSNHILTSQYFQHSNMTFKALHEQQLQYLKDDMTKQTSTPTVHFLKPGKLVPSGLDSAPNKVNSVAVWWTSGTQLFIYSLVKTAKDPEHKPEVVWPNAQAIRVSAISDCLSVLALGLENGVVAVWDTHRGVLLRVCTIPSRGHITLLQFLSSAVTPPYSDEQPSYLSSPVPVANLAVACDDGEFSVLQCGVAYSPPLQPLVDGSAIEKESIVSVHTLTKTPQVVAAIKHSGRMTLYDTTTYSSICHVSLPSPYVIDTAMPPCIAADGQVVVIKGVSQDTDSEDDQEASVLFSFPLHSFPSLNKYWRLAVESQPFGIDNTVETRFNSLIQDRISSQGTRQIRMQERWGQFKDELKKIQSNKTRLNSTAWFTATQTLSPMGR